jgi:hypothetical protein
MKLPLNLLRVVLPLALLLTLNSCAKKSPAENQVNQPEKSSADPIDKEIDEPQKQLQANRNLSLMVEKHNAMALWQGELKGKAILTINIQDSLIRADKRPTSLMRS